MHEHKALNIGFKCRSRQPHMFSLISLFLFSTLGLVVLTGRHLDAVPSLPRRPHPRATRLRVRSALEQDDFRQVSALVHDRKR